MLIKCEKSVAESWVEGDMKTGHPAVKSMENQPTLHTNLTMYITVACVLAVLFVAIGTGVVVFVKRKRKSSSRLVMLNMNQSTQNIPFIEEDALQIINQDDNDL